MSKDTITVNMNVHDIPILVEQLEEANKEISRLNNIINKFNKLLIEHIEEARYELNIILHSDNNLDYKNECSRDFDVLDKNIRMILDKLKDYKVEIFKCRNDRLHQSNYNIPDSVLTKETIIYVLKYNLESNDE